MIDAKQFLEHVIVPAISEIGLDGMAARELLLGTAIQESRLQYLKQLGSGPALGFFQMEPATHNDIWRNYLAYKPELAEAVARLAHRRGPNAMKTDLLYAAAMCRVHYLRVSDPLPQPGDVPGFAAYWKEFYNTYMGAGTEDEYIENWSAHGLS